MNCCDEYGNCNQGRDCPCRNAMEPTSWKQILDYCVTALAGIGVVAVLVALTIWSLI